MADTWILVADGVRARLFSAQPGQDEPQEIASFVNPEGRQRAAAAGRDRPPRTHDRMGPARHAIAPQTTARDKAAARFASELCDVLARARHEGRYSHLVLIAPPRFLGAIRASMDRRLTGCLTLAIDKDLTLADPEAIGAGLRAARPMRLS